MRRCLRVLPLLLLTSLAGCGDDDPGFAIDVSVSEDTLTVGGLDATQFFVTILDGDGNPAPIATGVTMICINTSTGAPYGSLGGEQEGIGTAETGLVGDAVLGFFCGEEPGLIFCTAQSDVGGGVDATAPVINCVE